MDRSSTSISLPGKIDSWERREYDRTDQSGRAEMIRRFIACFESTTVMAGSKPLTEPAAAAAELEGSTESLWSSSENPVSGQLPKP